MIIAWITSLSVRPTISTHSHVRFALRSGADAICEKPLHWNPWNIDGLVDIEKDTGRKVNTILQLRLHPSILELKQDIASGSSTSKRDVQLTYITARGRWYFQSWKGDEKKAGGIATNIGVHFYDMLHFIFGDLQENIVHYSSPQKAAGYLEYEHARVRWFLSVDINDVPEIVRAEGQRTYRSIAVDDNEIDFSDGFENLHIRSYEEILAYRGFGLEETGLP
ncbi:MAG: Gfo/Idh/MocA family oxidoreductase [Halioglobus sp.]|nr:Gfo/Idh/MocA family oxidoreductase [Halioglobus sp.]